MLRNRWMYFRVDTKDETLAKLRNFIVSRSNVLNPRELTVRCGTYLVFRYKDED